jgi:hypothetical protein
MSLRRAAIASAGAVTISWLFAGVASASTPTPVPLSADSTCAADAPDGWAVIPEVNTDAGNTVICNYAVARDLNGAYVDPIDQGANESGASITIEYFCTAQEGRAAFGSRTADRDQFVFRSDTKVVTEEGPDAANPDNAQPNPISSSFFSDTFGLQEKVWVMFNDQVLATLYVLTNERGMMPEDRRFGVTTLDPIARTLAAANAPVSAECAIPPIDGATGADGAGGVPGWVTISLGGAGVVTIGTWVWRRQTPRPRADGGSRSVPSPCRGTAAALERAEAELELLHEAHADLTETLERARKIHAQNIIKARIAITWEIAQTITGPATDLALALRPGVLRSAGSTTLGQIDNWHPPSSITPGLRDLLDRSKAMFDAARARIRQMTSQVSGIQASIELSRVGHWRAARAEVDVLETRLRNLAERLPRAQQARAELSAAVDAFDASAGAHEAQHISLMGALARAETNLKNAEQGVEGAARRAAIEFGRREAEEEAFRLQEAVSGLLDEVRRAEPGSAAASEAKERLASRRSLLEAAEGHVSAIDDQIEHAVAAQQAAAIRHREDVARLRSEFDACNAERYAQALEIDRATERARAFSDFAFPDPQVTVDRAHADVERATEAMHAAASATEPRLAEELARAQQQAEDAYQALSHAAEFHDAVRRQIDEGAGFAADTTGGSSQRGLVGKVASAAWYPVQTALTMTAEVVFGVGQSPKEIWDILVAGQENIRWLEIRLQQIDRSTRSRRRTVEMLRGRLDQCVTAMGTTPR